MLLVPGCSSDSEPTAGSPASSESTAEGGAAVEAVDFTFTPPQLDVAAGTAVTWTNADQQGHTVTAGSAEAPEPERFDEELPGGGTASITFDEAGTFAYYCTIHPAMEGTVVVE